LNHPPPLPFQNKKKPHNWAPETVHLKLYSHSSQLFFLLRFFHTKYKILRCMPRKHMREWRYSSTILELGTRWRGKIPQYTLYSRLGGPLSRGLDAMQNRKMLHCRSSLYRLSYPGSLHTRYPNQYPACYMPHQSNRWHQIVA
jgi:hypothetical protein